MSSEVLRCTTKFADLIAVLGKAFTRLPAEHVYARPTSHPYYQIVKLVWLAAVLAAWSIKADGKPLAIYELWLGFDTFKNKVC
jgi:hypothetical protein